MALLALNLFHVVGDLARQDHIADLDPIGDTVLVEHVQGQDELNECEEDLEDLLLGEDAEVGVVVHQLAQSLQEHGQEDGHGLVVGLAVLGRLVLVDLAELVVGLEHRVPGLDVIGLDVLMDLLIDKSKVIFQTRI